MCLDPSHTLPIFIRHVPLLERVIQLQYQSGTCSCGHFVELKNCTIKCAHIDSILYIFHMTRVPSKMLRPVQTFILHVSICPPHVLFIFNMRSVPIDSSHTIQNAIEHMPF